MKVNLPIEEINKLLEVLERDQMIFHNLANQWQAVK